MRLQWLLPILLLSVSTQAPAGSLATQFGWVHIHTNDDSQPLQTEMQLLGAPSLFDSPGTSATVGNADTLLVAAVYSFSDHWSIKFEGGYPPEFDFYAQGTVAPPVALGLLSVDLGAHKPLATARQWAPATILQYSFRSPEARLRPYIGLGAAYFWFTNVDVNPETARELNSRFGAPLALLNGKPGPTSVEAAASPSLAPLINLGVNFAFNAHWGMVASFSYVDLSTESTIDIKAADGSRLAHSKTKVDLDPTVTALLLTYKF